MPSVMSGPVARRPYLDQLSGPEVCRGVERASVPAYALGIPLTVTMAVLTFVHLVKIS